MKPRKLSIPLLYIVLVACQNNADTTPPTIASSVPASGATNIALSSNLAITFSEAMNQSSVTINVSPALSLGTPVWNTPVTVAFDPPNLEPDTSYTVTVEGKDQAGNNLSGNKTITFQTIPPPDNTPPATPSGVKATAGDGEFFVDWNPGTEPDLAGYTVYVGSAADALAPILFVEKPTVLAKVTGLENGKTYFYAVDAQDTSGNRSVRSATASVTPKDNVAPTLASSEPANGAQDLMLVPALRFTFSEPMDTVSVQIGMCVSADPPATATCATPTAVNFGAPVWSEGDTVARFTPTDQLQSGKTHVLVISAKDKGGNPLSGPNTVAFSLRATPDTTPPTVVSRNTGSTPTTGQGFVELIFDEAMDQQSVQAAFLSQPAIACSWIWTGNTARCNGVLEQLSLYTITLGTGARDSAGNAMLAPYQFGFTTPNFNPRVLSFTPSSRFGPPINVSPTSPIVLNFSEPMEQPSTQAAFEVRVGTTLIPGTFTWNTEGTQMTYTPSSFYGFGATVSWKLGTGAMELGSGRMVRLHIPAEVSGSFTTRSVIGR
ncbi:MAG: Ig-like domain-containing protein [Meiothermus ruber]|jgi:methionine-rich copper-binding protein CopC|uniref:Fibronectin type-III domain-containing protein n=1 Tax=Meiothermus ruber TaxID=277 RepID=A0A7C3HZ08_MEIRU|nr:Ig-like domain-containing protein [Meiothermus ruber]